MILKQQKPSRNPRLSAPILPGSQDALLHNHQGSQGNLHLFHPGSQTLCSMAIREAETQGASQADSLHQSHTKSIQHPEEQAIEGESKSQLDFLSTCQATIEASPVELCSALVASYHILMGQALMSHPSSLSQGASSSEQVSAPVDLSSPVPEHSPRPKQWHPFLDMVDVSPLSGTTSKVNPEGPPSSK